MRRLTDGVRRPVLYDARITPDFDESDWTACITQAHSVFSSVAILVDPDQPPVTGDRLDVIDRWVLPVRGFTDAAEAIDFLRSPDREPGEPTSS